MRFRLREQSGNIVLILMLGTFVLALGGGIWFALRPSASDENDREAKAARAAYDEAVAQMEKALQDPSTVQASLDRNAAFQCLFSVDGNCQGRGGAFLLFESAQSNHPLSHLARDSGADSAGTACKGFPSAQCPLRVETVWEPVCNARCEGTKSFKVKAKITLASTAAGQAPLEWMKENLFTPQIQLSQATNCSRGGGQWTGSECLTPAQVAERRLASPAEARPENAPSPNPPAPEENPAPVPQVIYECPNQIVVQGQYYPVQFMAADRGQVAVPAMSCQMPGMQDVFVFQCAAKPNPGFPNEGQWIQVEAVMAPACNQDGSPIPNGANLPTRF